MATISAITKREARITLLLSALAAASVTLLCSAEPTFAGASVVKTPKTYCNPINLDYDFELHKGSRPNHRSTADPVCIMYKDKYYLFATNQEGYWWSDNDMATWNFVPCKFKVNASDDQVCAPAAWPAKNGILFLPCFTEKDTMPLYISPDPASGKWSEAVHEFPVQTWDPSLFEDDDGRLYLYYGSSNVYPIYGVELDAQNGYKPKGKILELLRLDPQKHGWERFGENNQHGKMAPFIEGAWMNKFGGRYYLQYGAPGTEFNVYGDGVYVSDQPLGPFKYQDHNPFSWKPTGFARGAGHGSTFADRFNNLWHVATMVISVKDTFERRLGLFPAGVDKDGILFADTAFGDYPHYLPSTQRDPHTTFTNWMLLSYKKRAWASASKELQKAGENASGAAVKGKSDPALAFDEDIKTYWTAPNGNQGHYLAVDLAKQVEVRALQINYADEECAFRGKQMNVRHRYQIFQSLDGKKWDLAIDKSRNESDVPHDYIELSEPISTRYLKLVNIEMPTGCFAISDFRIFGKAPGAVPEPVTGFSVTRGTTDRRDAVLSWKSSPGAYAYEVSFGVSPDKLYSSLLVYDTRYELHSLNVDSAYYFKIRPVSECGIGTAGQAIAVE